MDDKRFQQWTEILGELRELRLSEIHQRQQDKSNPFDPDMLMGMFATHFESLLSKWWGLEKESWENSPPADTKLGTDTLKNELDSLVELELERIKSEIDEVKESETSWRQENLETAQRDFEKISADLLANFSLKIDSLQGKPKAEPGEKSKSAKARASQRAANSSSNGVGGFWLLFMFALGALLGAAPTVYYWDLVRKGEEKFMQEITQLKGDRKILIGKLSVLQEAYRELALGKTKNIPQLEQSIEPIRRSFSDQKERLEKDYIKKQAELIKKIPAGDRLDKSLQNLKVAQERQRAGLEAAEQNQIEPLLKELQKHKSILEGGE